MIVVDTSGLLAALDASERHHVAAVAALRSAEPPYLLSPFVLAELDYLLMTRVSPNAAKSFLNEVARGAYQLESMGGADVDEALTIIRRYEDLQLGLADASVAVLAVRHGTDRILTLDERHFRAIVGANGRPFQILPADGS
jgi:predicted nucleic acid-binding protein